MRCILILSDLATDRFLKDWAIVYLVGGAAFAFTGFVLGWMIWRKYRKAAVKVEDLNREAIQEFEEATDRVARLKSELSNPVGE